MTDPQPALLAIDPSTTCTGWALFLLPSRIPTLYGSLDRDQRLSGAPAGLDIAKRAVMGLPRVWADHEVRVDAEAFHVVIEVPGPAHIARLAKTRGGVGGALDVATTAGAFAGIVLSTWPESGVSLVRADVWNPGGRGRTREDVADRVAAEVPGYASIRDKDTGLDVAMAVSMGQWYVDRAQERRPTCPG